MHARHGRCSVLAFRFHQGAQLFVDVLWQRVSILVVKAEKLAHFARCSLAEEVVQLASILLVEALLHKT